MQIQFEASFPFPLNLHTCKCVCVCLCLEHMCLIMRLRNRYHHCSLSLMCHSLEMRSELSAPLPTELICHPVSHINGFFFPCLFLSPVLSVIRAVETMASAFRKKAIEIKEGASENKHRLPLLSQIAPSCKDVSWYLRGMQGTILARSSFYSEKSSKVTSLSAVAAQTLTSCS